MLCLSLSLYLCLRVMLCCVVCIVCVVVVVVVVLLVVVVCVWCVCLVSVCLLRHAEKTWKNPCVDSKTPPCVHSKRPRVCRHHAHMCFNMCAWCPYTRERFECTHGGVFESTHGWSSSVLLTKKSSRRVLTWPQRGSPKKPLDHTHFQFENRSRTTCLRFHQSFALPDKAVQFPLFRSKHWRESATRWFD